MNADRVAAIAGAVLYEGYILYPYRPSALKNQQRFNFGVLAPRDETTPPGGAWMMRTECLARRSDATLRVRVRFLHLTSRALEPAGASGAPAAWQEAIEREVLIETPLDRLFAYPVRHPFVCPASQEVGAHPDVPMDTPQRRHEEICGEVQVRATVIADGLSRLSVQIGNVTPSRHGGTSARHDSLMKSMVSTHALLHLLNGEFVSLLDPPVELAAAAAACDNIGAWPVLVGDEGERDTMLASPIILYDYPQIAPESAGSFFDSTEIDEMLVLRILTMTNGEKEEMRASDPRARRLLEQTESLPQEHLMKLHGVLRGLTPDA